MRLLKQSFKAYFDTIYAIVGGALGTPSSGTLTNCTTATATDNDADTTLASTAFAKSQDAVLMREPDQGVAMTAAASGSSGITVADSVHLDHGTGAGFLSCKRKLESWTVAAILMEKHDDTTGYRLSIAVTTGYVVLELNNTTYTSTAAPGFAANTEHKLTATWSPGATNTTVAFYADGVAFGAPAAQANETTTDNAAAFYAMGTDAIRTAGTDYEDIVGNFAPTAAEVLDMYRNGIPESWKWGSQTSLVTNGGFDSDTTGWTADGSTIASVAGGQSGNCLEITRTAGSDQSAWQNVAVTIGKKYRAIGYVKSGSSGNESYIFDVRDATGGTGTQLGVATGTSSASWVAVSTGLEFTATTAMASVRIYKMSATAGTMLFDTVSLVQLGPTLALLPENIQNDKWYDASSNGLNATYPTTGWSLTRPPARKIKQPTPTAKTTAVTLTIAELLTGIITGTHSAGATQAYTLPTGTLCDAWPAFGIDDHFDWVLINLSAAAADTITITAGAGHTLVGEGIVQSANASTGQLYGSSAKFKTRKTASSTFVTYRIG